MHMYLGPVLNPVHFCVLRKLVNTMKPALAFQKHIIEKTIQITNLRVKRGKKKS